MARTSLNLDRQADARVFSFGGTGAGTDALVTVNKGTAAASTVVLDVKGSQNIAGDLNLIGNLNITGNINEQSVTNLAVTDLTITVNKGGSTPSNNTAGILIEGTSAALIGAFYYNAASATKFTIGDGTTQVDVVGTSSTQTLTNKSISGAQITSAVANATLAATVTTNANMTGPITGTGNVTSITAQTGTGTTFVMQASPTLTTPNIGVATGTSLATSGTQSTGTASAADGLMTWYNATNAFTQSFKASGQTVASVTYLLPSVAPTAGQVLTSTAPSAGVATMSWSSPGAGTVTAIGVTTANGVSGTSSGGSTPNLTITLGAITPTSVNGNTISTGTGTLSLSTFTLTVAATSSISGTNTGDQTTVTGNAGSATLTAITDDTTTNATEYLTWVTTASGNQAQKVSSTKLTFNPSTGTLSSTVFSGAGTGLTGTASSLTAGTVTTIPNLTGGVTSVGNATTVVTNANLTGDVTSVGNATTLAVYHRSTAVTGTQDSSNKVFTIANTVKSGSEQVFVNGQLLMPGSGNDYVYNGTTTVTFQAAFTAPASTDTIRVYGSF